MTNSNLNTSRAGLMQWTIVTMTVIFENNGGFHGSGRARTRARGRDTGWNHVAASSNSSTETTGEKTEK
jgi:hypothetical protein